MNVYCNVKNQKHKWQIGKIASVQKLEHMHPT